MQISAIYFPTFFQKADCTTFALSVCQSVGLSVSVTINFPSPNCETQPHTDQVPPSTIQYYPLLTQCHQVPTISIFFTTATTTTTNNKQRQTTSNEKQMHMQMIIRRGRPLANDHPEGPASCKWSSGGAGLLQMIIWWDQPLANDHPEGQASCKWSSSGTSLLQMNIQRGRPLACVGVLTPTATIFNGTLETTSVEEIQILICAKSNQRRPGLHSVASLVWTSIC